MSLVGASIDRLIDNSDQNVLPGVERLLRLHASASENWRFLIALERTFASGHFPQDDGEPSNPWYDCLDDLQRYEKRAKGELRLGNESCAVHERRRFAENASKLSDIDWEEVKHQYQRAIDTAESVGLEEEVANIKILLAIAAIRNDVSKPEVTSLWESAISSWQRNPGATSSIYLKKLAKIAVKSPVVEWGQVEDFYQKRISYDEEHGGSASPSLYWEFAEQSESVDQVSSETTSDRYSKAITVFKESAESPSQQSADYPSRMLPFCLEETVINAEKELSLDWEGTKLLYRGVIREANSHSKMSREISEGEGFTAEYTPLRGVSDDELEDGTTKEDIVSFLEASPEWRGMRTAQGHLVELRDTTREQLEEKYCPSGTKKDLIQLLVGECGAGVLSDGFRGKELAELVKCSNSYANQIAFRNPSEEVRGSEREAVLKNDEGLRKKNQCAACGGESSLHVHHIIPVSDGGTKDMVNLATLCRSCHREAHSGIWGPIIYDTVDEFWDWVEDHPSQ